MKRIDYPRFGTFFLSTAFTSVLSLLFASSLVGALASAPAAPLVQPIQVPGSVTSQSKVAISVTRADKGTHISRSDDNQKVSKELARSDVDAGTAAVISASNTAGLVRVNNLAILEALLNIVANGGELIGLGTGAGLIVCSIFRVLKGRTFYRPLLWGVTLIACGLALPGCVNWCIVSTAPLHSGSSFFY